jgi:PhoPQ-activated pathogenicity-related protein
VKTNPYHQPMKERIVNTRITTLIAALALTLSMASLARADFQSYLKRPEPVYGWEKRGEKKVNGGTIYNLHLVSQEWQGHLWEHNLQVFKPDNLTYPHLCGLYNTGGSGSEAEAQFGMMLAKSSGCLFANLYGIPKQPLYDGKYEDALIVYTWQKFLETGDDTWPLHFPMAKAVLKAMDVIQEFAKREKMPEVKEFVVGGASKRGWTTWLVGASQDKRVKAIAPMVIDILNVPAQIPHQLEAFGKPSEQVGDYTSAGMIEALQTERGKQLLALADPYSYRDILTLPKLIILGTNDRYWSQDALNLYWDGLKGPKWVSYTPNSGHGLEDRIHVFNVLTAFLQANAGNKRWPKMKWEYTPTSDGVTLTVTSDIPPKSARLYRTYAKTKDFRDSKWTAEPMQPAGMGFTGSLAAPAEGFAATFGEVTYEIDGKTFTLSTQIRILGKK